MDKIVLVKRFNKKDKYVIYPLIHVKDEGSYAAEPFNSGISFSSEELLDQILNTLKFSKEGFYPPVSSSERRKQFYKSLGVKSQKELHDNSINMDISLNNGNITFTPWQNKGPVNGFVPVKPDESIKLPINSTKERLIEALETTLSRCK